MPFVELPDKLDKFLRKQDEYALVPMGTNCSVAYYLRKRGLRQTAYPLDWTVTPMRSVGMLLENEFEDFLQEENLVFLPKTKRLLFDERENRLETRNEVVTPVVCRKYKILYPHDFSQKGRAEYDSIREKYLRRIEKLYETLISNRLIFFITNDEYPNEWQIRQYEEAIETLPEFGNLAVPWRAPLIRQLEVQYPHMRFTVVSVATFIRKYEKLSYRAMEMSRGLKRRIFGYLRGKSCCSF